MLEVYKDKSELWCLWGAATSAIMDYIETNEKVDSKLGWVFREGTVRKGIGQGAGYSVTIFSTTYDATEKKELFLSVQADVTDKDEMSVTTVKRCEVDEHIEKYL